MSSEFGSDNAVKVPRFDGTNYQLFKSKLAAVCGLKGCGEALLESFKLKLPATDPEFPKLAGAGPPRLGGGPTAVGAGPAIPEGGPAIPEGGPVTPDGGPVMPEGGPPTSEAGGPKSKALFLRAARGSSNPESTWGAG